jgi:hypothetical protein
MKHASVVAPSETADSEPAARELPWNIPVPLKRGDFVGRRLDDGAYNVTVDLGAIRPFARRAVPQIMAMGCCDMQTNPDVNARGRLGAGRSVFYLGQYLKGVGRTQLAGNWADPSDAYHATGHLAASAAAREYLVSRYLAARGLSATIVPCDRILARRFRRHEAMEAVAPAGAPGSVAPVDRRLQALTVKQGGFARLSNFLYALDRGGLHPDSLLEVLRLLHRFSAEPLASPPAFEECTPRTLARQIVAAVMRGLRNFGDYMRAGVFWGSLHNNSAADGRFLDMETPTIVGGPMLGLFEWRGRPGRSQILAPLTLEVTRYVTCSTIALCSLAHRFDATGRQLPRTRLGEFLRLLAASLLRATRRLPKPHELTRRVVAYLGGELGLSTSRLRRLMNLVDALLPRGRRSAGAAPRSQLVQLKIQLCDTEPASPCTAYFPRLARPAQAAIDLGRMVNEAVSRVDGSTTVDDFFISLESAERLITQECSKVSLGERNFMD